MLEGYYMLNARGRPQKAANVTAWVKWFAEGDRGRVARSELGEAVISTVFVPVPRLRDRTGKLLLWETRVFGGPLDGEEAGYPNRKQAERGHAWMIKRVQGAQKLAWLAEEDAKRAAILSGEFADDEEEDQDL